MLIDNKILVCSLKGFHSLLKPFHLILEPRSGCYIGVVHIQGDEQDIVVAEPVGGVRAHRSSVPREPEQMVEGMCLVILRIFPTGVVCPVFVVSRRCSIDKIAEDIIVDKPVPSFFLSCHIHHIPAAYNQCRMCDLFHALYKRQGFLVSLVLEIGEGYKVPSASFPGSYK